TELCKIVQRRWRIGLLTEPAIRSVLILILILILILGLGLVPGSRLLRFGAVLGDIRSRRPRYTDHHGHLPLKDLLDQVLVMLLQAGVAADVNARFKHDVNRFVIFAAGFIEIPILEIDLGGLEIAVRAFDHSLNFLAAMRLFGLCVWIDAATLSINRQCIET